MTANQITIEITIGDQITIEITIGDQITIDNRRPDYNRQ
jgi:hypothetical protein